MGGKGYCSKLFVGLEKRLNMKMDINQIAEELCPDVKERRRKIIAIIKIHKGTKWLIENADWLGYVASNVRDMTPIGDEIADKAPNTHDVAVAFDAESKTNVTDVAVAFDVESIAKMHDDFKMIADRNRITFLLSKEDKDNGVAILGKLDEGGEKDITYWCQIMPSNTMGYYLVKITIIIHDYKYESREDDEDDEVVIYDDDQKMILMYMIYPMKADFIADWIDYAMFPDKVQRDMKKFMEDITGKVPFPKIPKFKRSRHPDWEWSYALTKRLSDKEWIERLERFGGLDWVLIKWMQ